MSQKIARGIKQIGESMNLADTLSIAEWHLHNWARWMRSCDTRLGYPSKSAGLQTAKVVGEDYFEIMCEDADSSAAAISWRVIQDLPPIQGAIIQHIHLHSVFRFSRARTEAEKVELYQEAVEKYWRDAQAKGLS